MEETIFAQIRKEKNDFFDQSISPIPGYSFNQYDTIKRCTLYHDSKFENGGTYLGRDLLFYNIVNPPCEVASKMLNVDTKNIRLHPLNPKSHFSTYLLEKELKTWLKMSEFSKVLNQIAEELPVYGSVAIEKTPDGAEVVDIRRLILDQSVASIEDSRFITTVHYMTESELRDTNWDNVDVAIDRFGSNQDQQPFEDDEGDMNLQVSSNYIKVYKRYGEVPEHWLGGKSDKLVKALFIVAGADKLEVNSEGKQVGEAGVILFSSKWRKEWPFRDFHYTKVKGRWLGRGVVEMLFDVQVRMNEIKNQRRIAMEIGALPIFTTPDKQIVRNVLTDLEAGDILITPHGLQPVQTEERNLAAYRDEEQSYIQHVERLTFAYEAVRGETPPSSTPLGTTEIATAQATGVFAFKRENVTQALREFFNELVIPQAIQEMDVEHIMAFVGNAQELWKLDKAASEVYANDFVKKEVLSKGFITPDEVEEAKKKYIKRLKESGTSRFIAIKKGLYSNAEFEFDINLDNEQENVQSSVFNLQKMVVDIATNPTVLSDPRLKLLYFKFAEKLGVSPAELELADEQAEMGTQTGMPQMGMPQSALPQGGQLPAQETEQ